MKYAVFMKVIKTGRQLIHHSFDTYLGKASTSVFDVIEQIHVEQLEDQIKVFKLFVTVNTTQNKTVNIFDQIMVKDSN